MKNKKMFLVSTEKGRVRGKISFYIAEIIPNIGLRLIDNDFTCSSTSNRGILIETVNCLVQKNELPKEVLDDSGYVKKHDDNYIILFSEGQGLNYINQVIL